MPTQNPRVNVVLDPGIYETLCQLAKKAGVSISMLSRDLIKDALEIQEDLYWQKVVEKRDKSFTKKSSLSHEDIWG